jgi:hypothetical protein
VDSKIPYDANALGLMAEPFEKHQGYDWPGTPAALILISLLSLGLWAAIWGACLASRVFG